MDIKPKFEGVPVTTDIPMLYDETMYKVFIILGENKCNNTEIKAVSKVCNINFIQAKSKLTNKRTLIAQGGAFYIKDIILILSEYDVKIEIDPPYPYELSD